MAAVLVHIDLDGDRPHPASLVALAAGRQVASSWGATVYAAFVRHDPEPNAQTKVTSIDALQNALGRAGADKLVVALTTAQVSPLWASVGAAWQAVLDQLRPRLVLFGAEAPSAAELAARTGARIGARLLCRARAFGIDDVELRDRDGGYARASDGGAAVAMIAGAATLDVCDLDIDVLVIPTRGHSDERIELTGTAPAEVAHTCQPVIVLADELATDAEACANARRLASKLGGQLAGSPSSARAGIVGLGAVVDRSTPLVADLVVTIGGTLVDVSGATSLIRIGAQGGKNVEGALPGMANTGLAAILDRLEKP